MTGLLFDLGALPRGASHTRVELQAADLGLPSQEWADPIVAALDIERNGDRISVRGKLEGSARLECFRCLKTFELPVRAPFEVFAERSGSASRADEAELERDDAMRFHDGRRLDLREEAREGLLLELPMAPRCREGCMGLCPRCGEDLNVGPCACDSKQAGSAPESNE